VFCGGNQGRFRDSAESSAVESFKQEVALQAFG